MSEFYLELNNLTIVSWPIAPEVREKCADTNLLVLCRCEEDLTAATALGYVVCGWEENGNVLSTRYVITDPEEVDDWDWPYIYNRCAKLPVYILETKRCDIREQSPDDVDEIIKIYEKPHVTDFIEKLFPRDEEIEYIKNYVKYIYEVYGFGLWVIIDKESDKIIGRAGFEIKPDLNEGEAMLGYMIDPDYQRMGYAYEVLSAITEYAKTQDITKLIAIIDEENTASVNLAKKLGLKQESKKTWSIDI